MPVRSRSPARTLTWPKVLAPVKASNDPAASHLEWPPPEHTPRYCPAPCRRGPAMTNRVRLAIPSGTEHLSLVDAVVTNFVVIHGGSPLQASELVNAVKGLVAWTIDEASGEVPAALQEIAGAGSELRMIKFGHDGKRLSAVFPFRDLSPSLRRLRWPISAGALPLQVSTAQVVGAISRSEVGMTMRERSSWTPCEMRCAPRATLCTAM